MKLPNGIGQCLVSVDNIIQEYKSKQYCKFDICFDRLNGESRRLRRGQCPVAGKLKLVHYVEVFVLSFNKDSFRKNLDDAIKNMVDYLGRVNPV